MRSILQPLKSLSIVTTSKSVKMRGTSCSTRLKNFKLFLISTKKWLYNTEEGKRADLSDADLRGANLCGAKNIPEISCEDFMKRRVCDSFSPDKAYNHQL